MSHVRYTFDHEQDIVQIEAKLPKVREVFAQIASGTRTSDNNRWEHLEVFDGLPAYPMDDDYHMGRLGNPNLIAKGKLNLTFFRAVNLDEGIELTLLKSPVPWADIRRTTTEAINDLLRRHYAPQVRYTLREDGQVKDEDKTEVVDIYEDVRQKSLDKEATRKVFFAVGDRVAENARKADERQRRNNNTTTEEYPFTETELRDILHTDDA